eukprot:m.193880 g.193880  ORF g.193880 m.193880 type:complete len:625 (-) comp16784_c5_seq6:2499-4373(-)
MASALLCLSLFLLLASLNAAHAQSCVPLGEAPSCSSLQRDACQNNSTNCGDCLIGHVFNAPENTTSFACERIRCGVPPSRPLATPASSAELLYQDVVTYTCNVGAAVDGETFEYEVKCQADGTFATVIPNQNCHDIDYCASNPCGEQLCQETAAGDGYMCRCKQGFAGVADEDGNGCFVPEMTMQDAELAITARDVVLNLPTMKRFTSFSALVDAIDETAVARASIANAFTASLAVTQSGVVSLHQAVSTVKATDIPALSSAISQEASIMAESTAQLSQLISMEASTAQLVDETNAAEIETLRELLFDLATNVSHLDADHDVTRALATALEEDFLAEKQRATIAESSIQRAVTSYVSSLAQENSQLRQTVMALTSRVEELEALPPAFTSIEDVISRLVLLTEPKSCKEVLLVNPSAPSGVYKIRPLGFTRSSTIPVYCDMTTDGGGWTRTARIGGSSVITERDASSANNIIDYTDSGFWSFSAAWFNTQPSDAMIIEYASGGGASYGAGQRIRITWNDNPFTYGVYNNHRLADCRNLNTGTVWPACNYAAHQGDPWQSCSFSFTSNNIPNGYSSNQEYRIILGPTARPGGTCIWYNFGANSNSANLGNNWVNNAADKLGYIYFR